MATQKTQKRRILPEEVTVAIFCALVEELAAIELIFDEELTCQLGTGDYVYSFGRIHMHNVVVAKLQYMGTVNASAIAAHVSDAFKNIRFALLVGIAGGIPGATKDVRLGDLVISSPQSGHPGVISYDFGKYESDGFVPKESLNKPPRILQSADDHLQKEALKSKIGQEGPFVSYLNQIIHLSPQFKRPDLPDVLYHPNFSHVMKGLDCSACEKAPDKQVIERSGERGEPVVHRGLIMSGNGVIKDPNHRTELSRRYKEALCFEMEAAGIMDQIPCLVIRGICDYCDTHKQDGWHNYAAAVAAAYAKAVLEKVEASEVTSMAPMCPPSSNGHKASEISEWLSPVDFLKRKSDILSDHTADTTEWFFETDAFLRWRDGNGPKTLYLEGINGAGKSMLASLAVDHLTIQQRSASACKPAVLCAYYDYKTAKRNSCVEMLAGILKQFLLGDQPAHPALQQLYTDFRNRKRPSKDDLFEVLCQVLQHFTLTYVIIDGLDECILNSNFKELGDLINGIQALRQSQLDIRLFTTSRRNPVNEELVGGLKVTYRAKESDLITFFNDRIGGSTPFIPRHSLWVRAKKEATSAARGMFLVARLKAEAMRNILTESELEQALQQRESALHEIYNDSLIRLDNLDTKALEMTQKLIAWAVLSTRPLHIDEVGHALAITEPFAKFDTTKIPNVRSIVALTQGLIVVQGNSQEVRPIHETAHKVLEDYLQNRSLFRPRHAHQYLGISCIRYLSSDEFDSGISQTDQDFEERLDRYQFYHYASHSWGDHIRKSGSVCVEATEFLSSNKKAEASAQALLVSRNVSWSPGYSHRVAKNMTGVHLAAYFGIDLKVKTLARLSSIDGKDTCGRTPFWWAARNGHYAMAKALMGSGAQVDVRDDNEGRTPLSWACQNGYGVLVELLIAKKADVTCRDRGGIAAICWAVRGGHEFIVKSLLNAGAEPDALDVEWGMTILSVASELGHEAIVSLLLSASADVEAKNNYRRDWLREEIEKPKEAICWTAEAKRANLYGITPLLLASRNGHDSVVRTLLRHGAYVESKDSKGRTPLSWAAEKGPVDIVKMLLDRGANMDARSVDGRTPLVWASRRDHHDVVQILKTHSLIPEQPPSDGRVLIQQTERERISQLTSAVQRGDESAVRYLLRDNTDLNAVPKGLVSPLYEAARMGHLPIVIELLKAGADPNFRDSGGNTPLCMASNSIKYALLVRAASLSRGT